MKLENRLVLVAGAGKGIGKELALQLAEKNNRLILFSRSVSGLADEPRFRRLPQKPLLHPGDIRNPADIEALARSLPEGTGIDGIIVCSGVSRPDFVEAPDINRAVDTLRTNLEGPMRFIYTFLPSLLNRPQAFIAGFTSMAGDRGMPRGHAYSASKAGLDRFLDSLRIDLLDLGISVFTIAPGYVESDMTRQNQFPMHRIMPTAKAARHIITCFESGKRIIRLPWYHALGMKLLNWIPDILYWPLMNSLKRRIKINPQADDQFQWKNEFSS
jgi:short-subunit dehydrogenase